MPCAELQRLGFERRATNGGVEPFRPPQWGRDAPDSPRGRGGLHADPLGRTNGSPLRHKQCWRSKRGNAGGADFFRRRARARFGLYLIR